MKNLLSVILLFLLAVSPLPGQSKGGRWQFEVNGVDSAPWDAVDNSGVLQGTAVYSSMMSAPEGLACLWLESTSAYDFFKIEDQPELDFDNENIAISAWIHPTLLNDVHFILNKGTQTNTAKATNYAVRIAKTKKLEFLIRDSNNQAQTAASSFTLPVNQWTFIAVWYDYAAGVVYFWNRPSGAPVDSVTFRHDYFSNDGPLSIGSWYRDDAAAPSIKDFEGGIDDVRISSRREDLFPAVSGIKAIGRSTADVPLRYRIFPNPSHRSGGDGIRIQGSDGVTEVSIFNLLGRKLFAGRIDPGRTLVWPLRDLQGIRVDAGVYFVQLVSGGVRTCQKVTVLD
ncbi:MAG TPA: T9SS type A sorting domain-containing protein [bacterium]|nr:T9SS type A sorting domain-containing protein [bacterium]